MLDKETPPKSLESGHTMTISREGAEAPISRRETLAAPAKGGWFRRVGGLGALTAAVILLLLLGVTLGISADSWRQGTVWQEFSRGQKLMYLQGYSAGFLAGAQQAFQNPDGLKDFYKSLAKTSFRQGEVIINQYVKNNPHKLGEPLGNLIFEAYNEAAKGAAKAPERVIAAKSAPKPPESPAAQSAPKAPESPVAKSVPKPAETVVAQIAPKLPETPAPKGIPKAPERVPATKNVPKNLEEIKLGPAEPSQLPKTSGEIKEVKKGEVQTKTEIKARVTPPLATSAYTPPRESDERKALFVSLAEYMDPSKILRLNFVVKDLKVNNGWAWVLAVPQSRDGETQYAPLYALMHRQNDAWKVKAYTRSEKGNPNFLSSTGYLEKLEKRFPEAPLDIFPREGIAAKSAPKPPESPTAQSAPKAPETPVAKSAPKPAETVVAQIAPKPPETPALKGIPKAPEKVPAAKEVPKNLEEIKLGPTEPSQLPKTSGEIKEVKKGEVQTKPEVQTKTEIKARVTPPLATSAHTPPRESDERKALFVSLAEYMDPSKVLRLSFVVKDLKVNNGWAWVLAVPQSKDGEIQYAPLYALIHRQNDAWKVKAYTRNEKGKPNFLSSTGYLEKLKKRFPEAPLDIFPRDGE